MHSNVLIVQSGGATSVINSTLCGLVKNARESPGIGAIYGSKQGIYGLLRADYADLGGISDHELTRLQATPGTALGTWRHKLNEEHFQLIVDYLDQRQIGCLFYIGGNGSMFVANRIYETAASRGLDLVVIGLPKTIDNDIMHTHHTPGYGSAAKFMAVSTMECGIDIRSLWDNRKITVLETMGRNTGWLAAACALARRNGLLAPHHIYIPESPFSEEKFLRDAELAYETHGYSLVVVSEGIRDRSGRIIGGENASADKVGRPGVGGVSSYLAQLLEQHTPYAARNVVPSIWQRTGMHLASGRDLGEAYLLGKEAIQYAISGASGIMMTLQQTADGEFSFGTVPLSQVSGIERTFPIEWYDSERSMVKPAFLDYAMPLIQGEPAMEWEDGLPVYSSVF